MHFSENTNGPLSHASEFHYLIITTEKSENKYNELYLKTLFMRRVRF